MELKRGETNSSSAKAAISSKKLLGELTHNKITYYLNKTAVTEIELYGVFKDFFNELLELKKEFTCGELLKELDKVYLENETRGKLNSFILAVSKIEYKDDAYTSDDVKKLLVVFDDIVKSIIHFTISQIKQPGLISRFLEKIKSINKQSPKPQTTDFSVAQTIPEKSQKIQEIKEEPPITHPIHQLEQATTTKKSEILVKEKEPEVPKIQTEQPLELEIKPVIKDEAVNPKDAKEINEIFDFSQITEKELKPKLKIDPTKDISWTDDIHSKIIKEEKNTTSWANESSKTNDSKNKNFSEEPKNKINTKPAEESIKDLKTLIEEAKNTKNIKKLKQQYMQILKEYNELVDSEKKQYYPSLQSIYEKIIKK